MFGIFDKYRFPAKPTAMATTASETDVTTPIKQPYIFTKTFETRCLETERVLAKYPNKVPVICEPAPQCYAEMTREFSIKKNKFLVDKDYSVGQFQSILRTCIKLPPNKAMFFHVNGKIPATLQTMGSLYSQNKELDGYVYVYYTFENTFG